MQRLGMKGQLLDLEMQEMLPGVGTKGWVPLFQSCEKTRFTFWEILRNMFN